MYQNYVCVGRVTRDVELRYIPSGMAVCDLGIAINEKRKDKEETLFLDVTVWGKTAEFCSNYISRGRLVLIDGRLQMDKWTDKEGNIRSKIKLVCNNLKVMDSAKNGDKKEDMPSQDEFSGDVADAPAPIIDEDIPF